MVQSLSRRPLTVESQVQIPGQSMLDLWWTKWNWDRSFFRVLRFALSVSFNVHPTHFVHLSQTLHNLSDWQNVVTSHTQFYYCSDVSKIFHSFTHNVFYKNFPTELADVSVFSKQALSAPILKDTQASSCRNTKCCQLANTNCIPHIFYGYDDRVNCIHDPKFKSSGWPVCRHLTGCLVWWSREEVLAEMNGTEGNWQREFGSRHVTKFGQKVKLQCTGYNVGSLLLTPMTVQV
jgi:hypothetical protein